MEEELVIVKNPLLERWVLKPLTYIEFVASAENSRVIHRGKGYIWQIHFSKKNIDGNTVICYHFNNPYYFFLALG